VRHYPRASFAVLINPNEWEILGNSVLVKRYEKPEKIGSMLLPPAYRFDSSWILWEVVKSSAMATEFIGYPLLPDDILTTLRRIPPHVGFLEDATEVFVMGLDNDTIRGIVRWRNS